MGAMSLSAKETRKLYNLEDKKNAADAPAAAVSPEAEGN